MSYEEKGVWVYLVVSLGTYGVYLAVILGRADGVPLAEVAYVPPMLWSIGIAMAAAIVGRITVEIVKPSESHRSDPRDKDINRFGEYVGGGAFAIAMLAPFGLAVAEADHFWIANAMYAAFVLSALVGSCVKLVAYRRGL
ncbi:hypothetical protein [Planomonospora venezuelensis]|uniref:Drug/metabolite transporter (DMT)-like permease n=1 Tax=Planomonospora venezuelensis TaxID=1999 RepID=A0A841DGU8_PLAVE|nr:hypothetical protein [Planomonospora venezuelensis]MBB5967604.1 drug/metabolite transporter (DMT)-like permease [Planomonospora venezuelensis]GIN00256.1 hypothetical protein Pve01_19140 [Planomonospora venezuelensis]